MVTVEVKKEALQAFATTYLSGEDRKAAAEAAALVFEAHGEMKLAKACREY